MLYKFKCGCIAIDDELLKAPVCIAPCDNDDYIDDQVTFFYRNDLIGKPREALSAEDIDAWVTTLGGLIHDGHKLRGLTRLLGIQPHHPTKAG